MHGISTFVYEGLPNYPSNDRIWKLINNYKITKLLTESYIIKALLSLDETKINENELQSLKLISITGNFISQNDWERIFDIVCNKKIVLTSCFISAEIGNIVFADIPGISDISPGYVNIEFPSVEFEVIDSNLKSVINQQGLLICKDSFLSSSQSLKEDVLLNNFFETKFVKKKNFFSLNHFAELIDDKIKILQRADDKLEIAGELVSNAQVQSVIESHPKVKSCKVESKPDSIFNLLPIALVELNNPDDAKLLLKEELRNMVEKYISVSAKPVDVIFIQ